MCQKRQVAVLYLFLWESKYRDFHVTDVINMASGMDSSQAKCTMINLGGCNEFFVPARLH